MLQWIRVLAGPVLVAISTLAVPTPAAAADGPQQCAMSVEIAPVNPEGTFPVLMTARGETLTGALSLSIADHRGGLTGTLLLADQTYSVAGRYRASRGAMTVALTAAGVGGRLRLAGALDGAHFSGLAHGTGGSLPPRASFTIDMGDASPLKADLRASLDEDSRGRVRGSGTVTVGSRPLAVAAKGRSRSLGLRLALNGHSFRFNGNGPIESESSPLSWRLTGFGSSTRGVDRLLVSQHSALPQSTTSRTKMKSLASDAAAMSGTTQLMSWAYYTDPAAGRWYISYIGAGGKQNVYSLMGFSSTGRNGWGTVGNGVASIDLWGQTVRVDPNLDFNPLHSYWDEGWQEWAWNALIHSDRQQIQGTTVPIKWYFFKVESIGRWYIVAAPPYNSLSDIRMFSTKSGPYGLEYDWVPVEGLVATFFMDGGQKKARFDASGEQPSWPMSGLVTEVTDGYQDHNGTDIASAGIGNGIVHPTASGTIIQVDTVGAGDNGRFVRISHGGRWQSVYLHLSEVYVTSGTVSKSTQIGREGNTGKVIAVNGDGTHLHFAFYYDSNDNNRCDLGEYRSTPSSIRAWQTRVYQGDLVPGWPTVPGR